MIQTSPKREAGIDVPVDLPELIGRLRSPGERFIFQGGSVYARRIAMGLEKLQRSVPTPPARASTLPLGANWPEDYQHECGEYQCLCLECRGLFIGYKRRVMCKTCWDKQ